MIARSWSVRIWLIALGGLGALPLIVLALWFSFFEFEKERHRALARIQETARAMAQALDGRFEARIAILQGLATANSLRDGRYEDFRVRASQLLLSLPPGSVISVSTRDGSQLVNTSLPVGRELPTRSNIEGVEAVFATGKPSISNVLRDAVSGRLVVSVDVPVFQEQAVLYDLGVIFPIEELVQLLRAQRSSPDWYTGLIDRNGILAARLPFPERFAGAPAAAPLWAEMALQGEGHIKTPALDGVPVYSTWSRSTFSGWSVAIAMPESFMVGPLWRRVTVLLAGGGAVLLAVLVLALLLGRAISLRMVRLAEGADAIASERPADSPPRGIREVDIVDQAIRQATRIIREQEARQRLLLGELDHRVKNMLATIQALINRTLGRTPEARALTGRVAALAQAHALLARTQGRSVPLRDIVATTLEAHRDEARRVTIEGPDILLTSRAAQGMALALHELTTNAVKHGSLSVPGGSVDVGWEVDHAAAGRFLKFHWVERDGPPVSEPTRRGFGSVLIGRMPQELDGTVSQIFDPGGVRCLIVMPAADVVAEDATAAGAPASDTQMGEPLHGRRILLVEDAALAAMEATQALEGEGCLVQAASDLAAAVALARSAELDAAVLDVNLNGERVFPAAYALRERRIPFIFLTGYDDPKLWPEDLRDQPRIAKPVQASELLAALRRL